MPRAELDVDALSRSIDGVRRVTVTARGLFLERHLRVQSDPREHYHPDRGFERPRWDHDTAWGGLGLSEARVRSWRGARVLDVGAGLSIVATELSTLGAHVDAIDREVDDAHPSWGEAIAAVGDRYAAEMRSLRALAASGEPRYHLDEGARRVLDELAVDAVATAYPRLSGARRRGDATALVDVASASYDAVLCGWVLVHLEPHEELAAVGELLRVVRPGGHLHLALGYGDEAAAQLALRFAGDARVELHRGGTLVLERR